jgi:hypothetical protein
MLWIWPASDFNEYVEVNSLNEFLKITDIQTVRDYVRVPHDMCFYDVHDEHEWRWRLNCFFDDITYYEHVYKDFKFNEKLTDKLVTLC